MLTIKPERICELTVWINNSKASLFDKTSSKPTVLYFASEDQALDYASSHKYPDATYKMKSLRVIKEEDKYWITDVVACVDMDPLKINTIDGRKYKFPDVCYETRCFEDYILCFSAKPAELADPASPTGKTNGFLFERANAMNEATHFFVSNELFEFRVKPREQPVTLTLPDEKIRCHASRQI